MLRAACDTWTSPRVRLGLLLLGFLPLTTACGRNQFSACGGMCCNEISFITLRTEARVSAEHVELVWHLAARPFELWDFWKTEQWPKLTVGVVVPLSSRGSGGFGYEACFGRGLMKLPGFDDLQPLVIRQRSLAVERRGEDVSAGGGVILEFARDPRRPPTQEPIRTRIDLYLKPVGFEGSGTLSPRGAEVIAQVANTCTVASELGGLQ